MDIWFHRYQLHPRRSLSPVARGGAREGALLRVGEGFADLHPWPELGDLPLDQQLRRLVSGETTALTSAALHHAGVDGEARRAGRSLFEGLAIPESHWPGSDPPEGFDIVKLKDLSVVPSGVRLRIDFNARLDADGFLRAVAGLDPSRIDFVEDPVPYDAVVWTSLRSTSRLRLAYDRPGAQADPPPLHPDGGFDVVVHKPALSAHWPLFDGEIVVTSYMDHPVGQLTAAAVAAAHTASARCGLMTHVLYEPNAFSERVTVAGARLVPPEGTGIGFDDLLQGLPWRRLR